MMALENVDSSYDYRLLIDDDEAPKKGEIKAKNKHVFVTVRRKRIYSEPDLDLIYEDDGTISHQLCNVDYSVERRIAKKFRKGYANWRKGGTKGAKGELNAKRVKAKGQSRETGNVNIQHAGLPSRKSSIAVSESGLTVHAEPGTETFANALLNSLNYNLGITVLGVPYFFAQAGWLMIPLLLLSSSIAWVTARMLGKMLSYNPDIHCYADICLYAFGSSLSHITASFVRLFQVLELFSYCVYGIIIMREMILALDDGLSQLYTYAIISFVMVPIVFLRSRRALSFISTTGVVIFLLAMGLVMQSTFYGPHNFWRPASTKLLPSNENTFFQVLGTTMLLFAGHAAFPSIYYSLENKKDYNRVVDSTYITLVSLVIIFGSCTYLAMGASIDPVVATNLDGKVMRTVGILLILVKTYCSGAIMISPIVREVELIVAEYITGETTMCFQKGIYDDLEQSQSLTQHINYEEFWWDESVIKSTNKPPLFELFPFVPHSHKNRIPGMNTDPITRSNHIRNDREQQARENEETLDISLILQALAKRRRESVYDVESSTKRFAITMELAIRFFIIFLSISCSILVPSIEFIMSIIGAIFAVQISITFPAILYYNIFPRSGKTIASLSLVAVGLVVTGVALYGTIVNV